MSEKDNSSLYVEEDVAKTAAQRTDYDSLSMLVNALLVGYLEDVYDPWDDFDSGEGWGQEQRHTWNEVGSYLETGRGPDQNDEYVDERLDEIEKRLDRLERVFKAETGIPPEKY